MVGDIKAARVFKLLSVEKRLRMIEILKDRCLCVNALSRALGISPAAVSQHLRVLRDAGLVTGEKRGYFVHYRINVKTLRRWTVEVNRRLAAGEEAKEKPETANRRRRKQCARVKKTAVIRKG